MRGGTKNFWGVQYGGARMFFHGAQRCPSGYITVSFESCKLGAKLALPRPRWWQVQANAIKMLSPRHVVGWLHGCLAVLLAKYYVLSSFCPRPKRSVQVGARGSGSFPRANVSTTGRLPMSKSTPSGRSCRGLSENAYASAKTGILPFVEISRTN